MQTTMQPVVVSNNPVIVLQRTGDLTADPKYHAKQSLVLGIIELISGVLCIIFNSVAIGEEDIYGYSVYVAGPGIWCGFFYIVAGILSLVSGQNKKKDLINASLAMNIVSSIFGFCLFIWAAVGVANDSYDSYYRSDSVQLGMGSMLLLLSLLVCVVSIWLYVIGCMSCCRARPHTTMITTVPAGTVINPGAFALQNLPTTQVLNTTGQANVAYAYQPHLANQQVMNVQPQFIQTPGYPQQQVIQTAAYLQPQQLTQQPPLNMHQVQMVQPPLYPHQQTAYPQTQQVIQTGAIHPHQAHMHQTPHYPQQPPASSAGSHGKSDLTEVEYEPLRN